MYSPYVAAGWGGVKDTLNGFFLNGLGGDGAIGIGYSIMAIGIVFAIISFAMHHFNPQSRMPSWFICLLIAGAGSLIMNGVTPLVNWYANVKNFVFSFIGA